MTVQPRALVSAIAFVVCAIASASAAQSIDTPAPQAASQPQRPPQPPPPTGLQPLPLTQLDERTQSDLLDRRTFTMTLSEPVPIKELLLMLVRGTPFSVVPDPAVQGEFIGELKNVTLRQALEYTLQPLGLDYSIQDTFIRVFKRRLETRFFDINYVTTRRVGSRTLGSSSAADPRQPVPGTGAASSVAGSATQVTGSDRGDVFDDIAAGLGTLLTPEGRFNIDRKAGLLQVHDLPDRLDRVALYLDAVQARVNRQVQIQARVLEIELSEQFAGGVNWDLLVSTAVSSLSVVQAPASSGPSVAVALKIRDFGGFVRALSMQGRVNVLSTPSVTAMNNEPAVMRVGTQDVFFVTTSQVDAATGRVLQTSVTPQSITEGITLSVTPQIASDGIVHLNISPSVTERTGQAVSRLGDTVPVLSVRESDTLVRVLQGDTVVIRGLMQDRAMVDREKVPVLGDIPGLGGAFRKETRTRRRTDLVILLTPTVMTVSDVAAAAGRDRAQPVETQSIAGKRP